MSAADFRGHRVFRARVSCHQTDADSICYKDCAALRVHVGNRLRVYGYIAHIKAAAFDIRLVFAAGIRNGKVQISANQADFHSFARGGQAGFGFSADFFHNGLNGQRRREHFRRAHDRNILHIALLVHLVFGDGHIGRCVNRLQGHRGSFDDCGSAVFGFVVFFLRRRRCHFNSAIGVDDARTLDSRGYFGAVNGNRHVDAHGNHARRDTAGSGIHSAV